MDWSNWVYLGVGLGIGFVSARWAMGKNSAPRNSHGTEPTDNTANLSEVVDKLSKTEVDYLLASQMCQFKAGFLSRISHELRSPLNGLIGAHQLILSDLCEDEAEEREFLRQANTSVQKMMDMLDRIVDVSRVEEGRNPLEMEPLQLAELFEEVQYLSEVQAANRNISLKVVKPDPNLYVSADQRCLIQVLVNFIDLAITPSTLGSIHLSAQSPGTAESSNGEGGDRLCIWLDLPLPSDTFAEPTDLLRSPPPTPSKPDENPQLSPGTILMMNQTLLELMQGRLEIIESPPNLEETDSEESMQFTRLQCSLPQAFPASPSQA